MIDQAALFEDDEDRAAFSQLVLSAYGTILTINESAGLAMLDNRKAVVLVRLLLKMLKYKEEQATEMASQGKELAAAADKEIADIWPVFQGYIDEELEEAQQMIEKLRAQELGTVH